MKKTIKNILVGLGLVAIAFVIGITLLHLVDVITYFFIVGTAFVLLIGFLALDGIGSLITGVPVFDKGDSDEWIKKRY